jgi:hypothetical protein
MDPTPDRVDRLHCALQGQTAPGASALALPMARAALGGGNARGILLSMLAIDRGASSSAAYRG